MAREREARMVARWPPGSRHLVRFAYERGGLSAGIWAVVGFGLTLASS